MNKINTHTKHGRIFFSNHALKRIKERFPHHAQGKNNHQLKAFLYESLEKGDNNRSFLNDTNRLQYFYDKYGAKETYMFIVSDDIVFVIKESTSRKVVVTCLVKDSVNFLKENKKYTKKTEEIVLTPEQQFAINNEDFDDFLSDLKSKKKPKKVHY
jgi:hypothetical protein